jgi:hypothetical protein
VYFGSNQSGSWAIWRRRANLTTPAELVYETEAPAFPHSISNDGKWLLFYQRTGGETGVDIWRLSLDDEVTAEPLVNTASALVRASSPYLPGTATGIFEGEDPVEADSLPYLTNAFGDRAVQFIEQHRDEPFFLFVSFNAPHTPMEPRPGGLEQVRTAFETDERAANVAMTQALDDNVGKILAALDAHELSDNTLVVFTNDNGGAMPYNGSLNAPLRGTKGTVLEGGNRVPMTFRWPARLPAAAVYEHPVSTLDFLPTFAALGGADTAGLDLDGVDLLPYLVGD